MNFKKLDNIFINHYNYIANYIFDYSNSNSNFLCFAYSFKELILL